MTKGPEWESDRGEYMVLQLTSLIGAKGSVGDLIPTYHLPDREMKGIIMCVSIILNHRKESQASKLICELEKFQGA